ncbi:MAG: hypothetical protein AAF547_20125 [Actinomycetota bacterium]
MAIPPPPRAVRLDAVGPDGPRFRPGRALRILLGTVLIIVGVLAIAPFLAYLGLVVVFLVIGDEPPAIEARAVATFGAIALGGLMVWMIGTRVVRGRTRVVLFLRKFGYDEAKDVVSHAAAQALGRRWRLVTLDDLDTTPVGSGTRVRAGLRVGRLVLVVIVAALGYLVFLFFADGLENAISSASDQAADDADNPVAGLIGAVIAGLIVGVIVGLVGMVFMLAVAVFGSLGLFAFVAHRSLRKAERDQLTVVQTTEQVRHLLRQVQARRNRFFSPRIAVVRSANAVWRDAVLGLADIADVVLVDVSDPTESLLWELDQLFRRPDLDVVPIGSGARLSAMIGGAGDQVDRTVLNLLAGRTVLVYDDATDRFAGALKRSFEATED